MIKINIYEAKTHLSRYLAMLSNGQSVLLCKRNRLIAEIRPLPATRKDKRPAQRESHVIEPLALDEESTLHLTRLPDLHRDPFDHMLICQAIRHGLILLTPDHLITQYPIRTKW